MKNITPQTLLQALINKKYKIFSGGPFDLNIIGIRSYSSESDKFDDLICILYKDAKNNWKLEKFEATTDPGKHWLLNPLNSKGTIIMVPGQYLKAFTFGKHGVSGKNPYEALVQCEKIAYVRDNNKDLTLDFKLYSDKSNIFYDICQTNIHRTSLWKRVLEVGMYSAGCQVIKNIEDFKRFMELCKLQHKYGFGKKFTYTLIEEKDI